MDDGQKVLLVWAILCFVNAIMVIVLDKLDQKMKGKST